MYDFQESSNRCTILCMYSRAVMYKSKCLKMIRNLNWKYTCCPSVPHSARSSSTEARSAVFYLSAPSSHTLFYSPSSETACRDGTETNSERRKGGANASICMYVATTYNNATRSSTIGEYIALYLQKRHLWLYKPVYTRLSKPHWWYGTTTRKSPAMASWHPSSWYCAL